MYVMIFQFSLPSVTITGYSCNSHFLDDDDRDGPQNIGLLAIQPADVAARPRIFCLNVILFFLQATNQNQDAGNESNMTVTVLYSKYDVQQLAAIVGTDRAARMVSSERNVHMFVTGE